MTTATAGTGPISRVHSIDILRGLVMIIMALDHVRDFTSGAGFSPTDLAQTDTAYFFTRWITHLCAPVFIFLAGTSAYLWEAGGKTKNELSKLFFTRGLWLIFIELYVINPIYTFQFREIPVFLQVIWVIGVSMVIMAALVRLPLKYIALVSIAVIGFHNAFDGIQVEGEGIWTWLWLVLHQKGAIMSDGSFVTYVTYPLLPWFGVMGLGYVFGAVYRMDAKKRKKFLLQLGFGLSGLFVVLRLLNIYGDPNPWQAQDNLLYTFLSFLNTTKYPVSLLFLLMTMGPAMFLLVWFEKMRGRAADFIGVYGRVPFFYYILHFFLAHVAAIVVGMMQGFEFNQFLTGTWAFPEDYGLGLPGVYLAWLMVVALTYLPCKWYANLKKRNKHPLLTYL